MEKTSREYAEKMASLILDNSSDSPIPLLLTRKSGYIGGYMKAVEETNVKELRDLLEDAKELIFALKIVQLTPLYGDERAIEISLLAVKKYESALQKAKEVK